MINPDAKDSPQLKQVYAAANEQERLVDAAYAKYEAAAAKVTALWREHSELQMFGDKAMRTVPKGSKGFSAYTLAVAERDELHIEWQRAASKHGHMLIPRAE